MITEKKGKEKKNGKFVGEEGRRGTNTPPFEKKEEERKRNCPPQPKGNPNEDSKKQTRILI